LYNFASSNFIIDQAKKSGPIPYCGHLFLKCKNEAIKHNNAPDNQKPFINDFLTYFLKKIKVEMNKIDKNKQIKKITDESKNDGWDNIKTLQELETKYTNLIKSPSRTEHEHYRNYYHPIAIFSANDEA